MEKYSARDSLDDRGFRKAIYITDGFVYEAQRFDVPNSLSVVGRRLKTVDWLWLQMMISSPTDEEPLDIAQALEALNTRIGIREWKIMSGDGEPTLDFMRKVHGKYSASIPIDAPL